ncbi:MAG: hypothetical protein ACLT4E_10175 [Clostridium sp.]
MVCENQLYENVALVTDDTMADKLVKSQLNGIVKAAIEADACRKGNLLCYLDTCKADAFR